MTEFLAGAPLALPEVLAAPPAPLAPGDAVVTPSFARGAALLRSEAGKLYRLSWEAKEERDDRRRALPAGKYALVGYRLIATDAQSVAWHQSVGGKTIQQLALAEGEERRLEIDATVRIETRLAGEQLQVAIQGEKGAGLSLYKAGKRIPIGYRLADAAGKPLAEGKINYG